VEWIFEMDVLEVVVMVEVDCRDNMELGMEDIEDIVDFSHNLLAKLVAKISFRFDMAKVVKEIVYSNYFEVNVHNLEIVN